MIKFKREKGEVKEHSGENATLKLNKPSGEMLIMMILKSYDNLRNNAAGFREKGNTELADILDKQADWVEECMKAMRDGRTFDTQLYATDEECNAELKRSTDLATAMMKDDPELADVRDDIVAKLTELADDDPEMMKELERVKNDMGLNGSSGSKKKTYH
jgi:multidrug efflux pump subunit AcrB